MIQVLRGMMQSLDRQVPVISHEPINYYTNCLLDHCNAKNPDDLSPMIEVSGLDRRVLQIIKGGLFVISRQSYMQICTQMCVITCTNSRWNSVCITAEHFSSSLVYCIANQTQHILECNN